MGDVDALLAWGERERRDLPWRRTRDPWAVLVSELMLQQTQVGRVVPKYVAFLGRFPTPAVCAAAPVGEVVRAWAGLGYNRRAVALHGAARSLTVEVPRSIEGWTALPGVGGYTARAVMAYAFEADTAVVDTNVRRILSRRAGRAMATGEAQRRADAWLPRGRAWAWNTALMDLGQRVCTARSPRCANCPIAGGCAWRGMGPDPGTPPTRQSRFAGSDRQGRGRLVDALRLAPVPVPAAPSVMSWPDDPDRAERVWRTLVADGLAVLDGSDLTLP